MIKHDYYYELINQKIDNMLTLEQDSELSAHLEACPECDELYKLYSLIHDFSDSLLVNPPENFASSVIYKISQTKKPIPFRKYFPRIIALAGAAAVVSLVLWGGSKNFFNSTSTYDMASTSAPNTEISAAMSPEEFREDNKAQIDSDEPKFFGSETGTGSSPSERAFESNLFDPSSAVPGDIIAGFTLVSNTTTYTEDIPETVIEFEGEATLSGILSFENDEDGFWGKFSYFTIDDDCFELLPYATNDNRTVWFGFTNQDFVLEHLEIHPEDKNSILNFRAMITINSYSVQLGSTDGCNYASLKEIHSIERIY